MNPVPMMATNSSMSRALQTSDATYQAVHEMSESLGKVPVEAKDSPGFVANRILIPMINEAAYIYYEGLASAEDRRNHETRHGAPDGSAEVLADLMASIPSILR